MSGDNYSQFGEQQAILAWAAQVGAGAFLDVGAYDGRTFSNTLALAEQGWRGVCVEPAPDAAAACAREHRQRRVATIAAALVTSNDRVKPLAWTPGEPYSSLDEAHARAMTENIIQLGVACLHPSDLHEIWRDLQANDAPIFASIDSEGSSLELFAMLCQWVPIACACVEVREAERAQAAPLFDGWTVVAATECNIVAHR